METLNGNSKYLAFVNSDETSPDSLAEKFEEIGLNVTVVGIPCHNRSLEFYEVIKVVPIDHVGE